MMVINVLNRALTIARYLNDNSLQHEVYMYSKSLHGIIHYTLVVTWLLVKQYDTKHITMYNK